MIGGGEREKKLSWHPHQQIRKWRAAAFRCDRQLGTPTYNVDFARGLAWVLTPAATVSINLSSGATVSPLPGCGQDPQTLAGLISSSSPSHRTLSQSDNFPTVRPRSEAMRSVKTPELGLKWHAAMGCRARGISACAIQG